MSSKTLTRVVSFSQDQFILVASNLSPATENCWNPRGPAVITSASREGRHGRAKLFNTLEEIDIYVADPRQHYYECDPKEALATLEGRLANLRREIQDKQTEAYKVRALLDKLRA